MKLFLETESQTLGLGEIIGRHLKPRDLILLYGDLGAGKTTLVRGVARALHYRRRVTSPTFALAHQYRAKKMTLHHLDLYRLKQGQMDEIGLEQLLADPKSAVIVEWPKAYGAWPLPRYEIYFKHLKKGREVQFKTIQ